MSYYCTVTFNVPCISHREWSEGNLLKFCQDQLERRKHGERSAAKGKSLGAFSEVCTHIQYAYYIDIGYTV
jgi:hypothetical protein